jgi:hypothetical protein
MAGRATHRARNMAAAAPRTVKRAALPAAQRLAAVVQERDALRLELDTAQERIADLERRQAAITKRIALVLKSLHNLRNETD